MCSVLYRRHMFLLLVSAEFCGVGFGEDRRRSGTAEGSHDNCHEWLRVMDGYSGVTDG